MLGEGIVLVITILKTRDAYSRSWARIFSRRSRMTITDVLLNNGMRRFTAVSSVLTDCVFLLRSSMLQVCR